MRDNNQSLKMLTLTDKERASLPLGYSHIYIKSISPKEAEKAVTVYSSKYRKSDLFALASEKPVSKLAR